MSKNASSQERRQHPRLPVLKGLIEPINLKYDGQKDSQPAVLTDLSAGGMSLVLFAEPPHSKKLDMMLTIPGLNHVPIEGAIVRILEKGPTYNIGISFTKISKKHQSDITRMAQDYGDCETRLSLSLPEACVPTCTFHRLCLKPQKAPHWPPKA